MTTQVVGVGAAGVERSASCIRAGGILVYPTETVYGIGGDALDVGVVKRIRTLKRSHADKPMLVLTDEWTRVADWFAEASHALQRLMDHEHALPITLLATASEMAPEPLVGPEGMIGVRRTSDSFCRVLIEATDTPLLSTSANVSGESSPALFEDINSTILDGVDLAVDAGRALMGIPSTVVRVAGNSIQIVRDGAVDAPTIHEIVGKAT